MRVLIAGGRELSGSSPARHLVAGVHEVVVLSRSPQSASGCHGFTPRLCGAIRLLIENDAASGPFELVAPRQATGADFDRTLGRVLRRPVYAPAFAVRILLGKMSVLLLEGQRVVPPGCWTGDSSSSLGMSNVPLRIS